MSDVSLNTGIGRPVSQAVLLDGPGGSWIAWVPPVVQSPEDGSALDDDPISPLGRPESARILRELALITDSSSADRPSIVRSLYLARGPLSAPGPALLGSHQLTRPIAGDSIDVEDWMLDALAVVMSAAVVTGARFAPSAPVWFTRERPIRTAVCDRERTAPGWHFQPVADVVEFARQITAAARMEEIVRLGHSADLTEIVDACSVLTHGLLPASSLGATLSPLGEEGTLDIAANILTAWFDHASSLFGLVATTRFSRSARAAWRIRGSDLSTRSLAALLIQSAGGTIDSGPLCRECKQPFRPVAGERKCPACPPLTNAQRQRKTAANETPEHRAARQQKERDQRRQTREAKRAERVRPGSPSGIPGPSERP